MVVLRIICYNNYFKKRIDGIVIMKNIRNVLLLTLTALIWGVAFVAQTTGGDVVGPFSFNGIRSFMGALVLVPVIKVLDAKGLSVNRPVTKDDWKLQWKAGIMCGICLFLGSSLQQVGIFMGTPTGKAGFLTTCYVVLVPVLGIFLKKKCGLNIWIAVLITLLGLYLLCMNGSFYFALPDILLLLCALSFSLQIMTIDHYGDRVDPVRLSSIQFLTTGVISLFPLVGYDIYSVAGSVSTWAAGFARSDTWISLLYAGILSSGVGYTLQVVAQKGLNPTLASLIMSLESVFSVLAGWAILGQRLSARELCGCTLVFAAVVLAQIPFENFKKKSEI